MLKRLLESGEAGEHAVETPDQIVLHKGLLSLASIHNGWDLFKGSPIIHMTMDKDYNPIISRLAEEFEEKYKTYRDWTFDFEYPGFLVYNHNELPYGIYFTPGWSYENEVDIQVHKDGDSIDGDGILFVSDDAGDLFAIVKQWLDYLTAVRGGGVLDWHPGGHTWKPRRQG
jgi:hypothetical protein